MNESSLDKLLEDLKNSDEEVRHNATQELWQRWFMQKGTLGWQFLQKCQMLQEEGYISQAEEELSKLIADIPDFAEAWNRRAVLYYTIGQYEKSQKDCEQVIKLIPFHFGALHGLGLCHAALGNYREAIKAFKKALEIQPYAMINQRLILECTVRLR